MSAPAAHAPGGHARATVRVLTALLALGLTATPQARAAGGSAAEAVPDPAPGAATAAPANANAAGPSEPRPDDTPFDLLADHLLHSHRLLGDLGGRRSRLEQLGVSIQLFYQQFLSGKPSGGGRDAAGVFGYSGSYDFFTHVDLERLVAWPGADVLLHVKGMYDRNVNAAVGALSQPIDDADYDAGIFIDEFWLQQAALSGRVRLRIGFAEQQTVFDRNAYANSEDRQFMTTFLDNNAVVPLPNGLAISFLMHVTPWLELAMGAADADNVPRRAGFDTAFDGTRSLTGYVEANLQSPWEARGLRGSYRLGVFVDGRSLVDFRTGGASRGHVGAYLSFDQTLWRPPDGGRRGLGVFARAGYADPDVNPIAWFWSVGIELAGAVPRRERDVLGIGTYQTIGSAVYRASVDPLFDKETGIEVYYAIRTLGWLAITPDIQYIVDPGATGAWGDAFVGTIRLRIEF